MQHARSAILQLVSAFFLAAVAGPALADDPPVLKIFPTGAEAGEAPFLTQIPDTVQPGKILLRRLGDGKTFEGTIFVGGTPTYLAAVLDRLPRDEADSYQLVEESARPAVDLSGQAEVEVKGPDGKLEARLIADKATKPYIFPLIGPTGERYTRAFPMEQVEGEDHDHPHQRSCWFTFGNVNGVDFWAELPGHGTIVQTRHQKLGEGAAQVFSSSDEWKTPDGKTIMTDDRRIVFWNMEKTRIMDFDVTLHASHGPVIFGDTKEGMFGVRVASTMDVNRKTGGKITNAEGITDADAWGKASPWVDYTGPVAGKTVGIAILNRPDSFRYPTTWHVRDYGLFAANPFGYHDFGRKETGEYTLPPGESVHFSYRVILHEGTTDEAGIAAAFKLYGEPPKSEISGLRAK
jgi:hypothetical protein